MYPRARTHVRRDSSFNQLYIGLLFIELPPTVQSINYSLFQLDRDVLTFNYECDHFLVSLEFHLEVW